MKVKDLPIPNIGLLEIALIQIFFYSALWVMSDYTATLLTLIFPVVFAAILVFALVAETIEKSKTPRWYFKMLGISIIVPIITAIVFVSVLGADFDWTKL